MKRVSALLCGLLVPLAGLWLATEYVAGSLHHATALGIPWFGVGELRVYAPWAWLEWARIPVAPEDLWQSYFDSNDPPPQPQTGNVTELATPEQNHE